MAEPLSSIDNNIIVTQKPINPENPGGESTESLAPADKSPFRRIEFHPARKPFTGFTKGGGDGSFRLETLNPSSTSSNITNGNHQSVRLDSVGGGSSGKKRDASELANGWDPELSFGITFRRIGAGLENLGNTCFLNSVLQCLTYTEPLAAYLQSGKHQVSCRKAGFCALCAIQKHVSRALQSTGRSLAPKDLVSNLRCISRTFRNSRQEDAHEYMVNLLESMHKCCLPMGVPSESQNAYDKSLVHKIFGGRLRSQVKCMQCNYCSNKFDPFLDLSLEILGADTLDKAFRNFTAKEHLDGGAKQYQCQQCNQKVKALKQLTIYKAPNVLTVHLKRFGSHMSGHKIDKKIRFDSTLDLKPFVTGSYDGDLKYTLYGVLVHKGWSTHNGHYYCFVRTSSGMWYSLDDNRVYQVSEKQVFEQKAYMLFYFRDQRSFPSKKTSDVVHHQKDTQMKTGLGNRSLNGQQSFASVGIERNGLSLNPPKENQIKSILSNGSLNSQKPSVPVETMRNGFRTNAPEPLEKKEVLAPKSPESSLKCKNGDVSVPDVNLGDAASKTDKVVDPVKVIGGGESSGGSSGVEAQKEAAVVAVTDKKTELPKMESLTNNKTLDLETDKKTDNLPVVEIFTNNKDLDQETNKKAESLLRVESLTNNKSLDQETEKKEESLPKEESLTSNKTLDQKTDNKADILTEMESLTKKNDVDRKSKKKMKNFLKCKKVISMKFSANVLMGTSLNKRKKKKHKRTKKNNNLPQEDLVNEGPSSSEKVKADELVKPPVENGFKERISKDGAVLATNDLNGASNGIQSNNSDNSKQKDLLHLLTRGLVPRWDETESTRPSHIRETKRDLTIGYIGDEWDEEYDKGKRKKIRISKTEFDGKNPFQDIANERLNSEKPKLSKRPMNMRNKNFKRQRSGNRSRRL